MDVQTWLAFIMCFSVIHCVSFKMLLPLVIKMFGCDVKFIESNEFDVSPFLVDLIDFH